MNPSFAQAAPQPMHAGEPGYDIVLEAATAPLQEVLDDDRVELDIERMDRIGNWVFLLGNMRAPGGGRPDFSGTRFADAAEQGAMSDLYVALLRREPDAASTGSEASEAPAEAAAQDQAGLQPEEDAPTTDDAGFPAGGTWIVLDHAIGPGDVAWLAWPQEHAAPRALFGF